MAELRYAIVRFKETRAGWLSELPGGLSQFSYLPDFVGEIACALPRTQTDHVWYSGGLPPFFEHLTPEGWLRHRQARSAEIAETDDFGLLLRYGQDCIGAVSILDPAAAEQPVPDGLDLETAAAIVGARTISGVQRKLLAVRGEGGSYHPAGPTGPAPFIAKFAEDNLPNLVRNEALSLAACRLLLGEDEVTKAELGAMDGIDGLALLVERFDREPDGGKLRLEDFAQVLSRPRGRDYQGKYSGDYEEGAAVLRRWSARPLIDLAQYFKRLAVFVLLGNCDAHLKNFSLLERPEGLRLSPVYDVLNTYLYGPQGYSTEFALRLSGKRRALEEIDRDLLTAFGLEIGLSPQAVAKTFADLAKREQRLFKLLAGSGGQGQEWRQDYAAVVRGSWARLLSR